MDKERRRTGRGCIPAFRGMVYKLSQDLKQEKKTGAICTLLLQDNTRLMRYTSITTQVYRCVRIEISGNDPWSFSIKPFETTP